MACAQQESGNLLTVFAVAHTLPWLSTPFLMAPRSTIFRNPVDDFALLKQHGAQNVFVPQPSPLLAVHGCGRAWKQDWLAVSVKRGVLPERGEAVLEP